MTRPPPLALQLAAIVSCGVAVFGALWWANRPADAALVPVQDLPADVVAEVDTVWSAFAAGFEGRMSCVPDVELELVGSVAGGDARYLVAERRIEIAIPTTPQRFRESLAHELAHHVEHTCAAFAGLRDDLHGRIAPEVPWTVGPTWETTPSEVWAEAATELVLGERVRHADDVPVDPDVLARVAAWGAGDR